jgi:hypothetical protein
MSHIVVVRLPATKLSYNKVRKNRLREFRVRKKMVRGKRVWENRDPEIPERQNLGQLRE